MSFSSQLILISICLTFYRSLSLLTRGVLKFIIIHQVKCNGPNPPLTDIVFFRLFPSGFFSKLLKHGGGFHTLIKGVSVSSPTDVGSPLNF